LAVVIRIKLTTSIYTLTDNLPIIGLGLCQHKDRRRQADSPIFQESARE